MEAGDSGGEPLPRLRRPLRRGAEPRHPLLPQPPLEGGGTAGGWCRGRGAPAGRGGERSQAVRGGRCDRNGRAGSGDKQRCPRGGSGEGGRALLTVGVRGLLGKGARCPAGGMLVACSRPASPRLSAPNSELGVKRET